MGTCLPEPFYSQDFMPWWQESISGTVYEGSFESENESRMIPRITGSAYVAAESTLIFEPADPFRPGRPE